MDATIAQALSLPGLDAIDARALLRAALGVDDAYLIAHLADVLTLPQIERFAALAVRRRAGEPVAYILGRREFYSLDFAVTPAVLIPRPETELLVEWALEHIDSRANARVLDLGTGSGCIAVSIAHDRPHALVTAVDSSVSALDVARLNAKTHACANLRVGRSDWFSALEGERFDLIVSNPPYIAVGDPHLVQGDLRSEPPAALVAGADGLDAIRAIVAGAPAHLRAGGWLAFEHGYDQAARCRELLAAAGFSAVFSQRDLAGIERVSGGRLDAAQGSR